MAGNLKHESSSGSPEDTGSFKGNYPNGQHGNYRGANLDRSGSFCEGSEGRTFIPGSSMCKGNAKSMMDLPPLSESLLLEPFTIGNQKHNRARELRRALGDSVSEDSSLGVAHSESPTLATNELKRFRASVLDDSLKARNRVKRLKGYIYRLDKYFEARNSKKQQAYERSCGSNFSNMGTQSRRNSLDLATEKSEGRSKNVLHKRARTPMAEMPNEGRGRCSPRQHLVLGKDKHIVKEGSSQLIEEKICKLPAGGEGWDRKMKRKRSMSNAFSRPLDRRSMPSGPGNDLGAPSSDAHYLRPGSFNGANGIQKLEGTSSNSGSRGTPKRELEKGSLSREVTGMKKEKLLQKGNNKLNMHEETLLFSPTSITKGRASRAPRTGLTAMGTSPNFSRVTGTPEDWEQAMNVTEVHSLAGVNNRKRTLPTESSSPSMAKWAGQRPQKISRTRRTNIISPTSAHDEVQISSEHCAASDFSTRLPSGMNGSLSSRNNCNSPQLLKVDDSQSPARLSESEETGGVESKQKDKADGLGEEEEGDINSYLHVSSAGLLTKKKKMVVKGEIRDGVCRKGRSGRGPSFFKGSTSPLREKSDSPAASKPLRSIGPGSDKSGSKTGRPPLKKHSDRKGFTHLGPVPISSSPNVIGKSDDDREELLAAAKLACGASYNACSSSFWKRVEPLFFVRLEDNSFLEQQLKSLEDCQDSPTQTSGLKTSINYSLLEEACKPLIVPCGEGQNCFLDNGLAESARTRDLMNQFHACDKVSKSCYSATPLYHKVLSALILEDDYEEFDENGCEGNVPFLDGTDDFCVADKITCNGNTPRRGSSTRIPLSCEVKEADYSFMHPVVRSSFVPSQNNLNGPLDNSSNGCRNFSFDCQYEEMRIDDKLLLELQSIGLYPEKMPDLAEGEDKSINQDIGQLKEELYQQMGDKKAFLKRIHKTVEEQKVVEARDLEQLAMNKLTELAYKKLLATRGSWAARMGVSKVPRHVALAFIRRTLARCRKFEDLGKSFFNEPALRDVLFAGPPSSNNSGSVNGLSPTSSERPDLQNDNSERGIFDAYDHPSHDLDHAFAKNGPILNRGRKKEVLLDDVGGGNVLRSTLTLGNSLLSGGGAKGKRSERDHAAKAGCPPISTAKGERKIKSKPKQKARQMSSRLDASSRKRGLTSNVLDSYESNESVDFTNFPMPEFDSIEELGANDFGGHQDLGSWLNFDEDGLQDHDSMGLEIPMDDLSDLNMLL